MNEEAEPRRLTRRELREQWQAEQASLDSEISEESTTVSEVPDLAYVQEATESSNIAWSEDGEEAQVSMRRRRREAERDQSVQEPFADIAEADAADAYIDTDVTIEPAPTQPFTLSDLQELEQDAEVTKDEDALEIDVSDKAVADADILDEEFVEADVIDVKTEDESTYHDEEVLVADVVVSDTSASDTSASDIIISEFIDSEPEQVDVVDASDEDEALAEFDLDETAVNFEPESDLPKQNAYTFPDIQPLDDDRSIFDDDSTRVATPEPTAAQTRNADETNFDDLLERAIADESASVHNNTAALILPAFPDSDLTGPLGTTGELFITGSFELPKSLSETGGHASMLDRYDSDDSEDDHEDYPQTRAIKTNDNSKQSDAFANLETTQFDVAPKSARKAVSAKSDQSDLPTTPITKGDGKKPLIFGLVGGGLILVLAAGAIYLYNSGLFG